MCLNSETLFVNQFLEHNVSIAIVVCFARRNQLRRNHLGVGSSFDDL